MLIVLSLQAPGNGGQEAAGRSRAASFCSPVTRVFPNYFVFLLCFSRRPLNQFYIHTHTHTHTHTDTETHTHTHLHGFGAFITSSHKDYGLSVFLCANLIYCSEWSHLSVLVKLRYQTRLSHENMSFTLIGHLKRTCELTWGSGQRTDSAAAPQLLFDQLSPAAADGTEPLPVKNWECQVAPHKQGFQGLLMWLWPHLTMWNLQADRISSVERYEMAMQRLWAPLKRVSTFSDRAELSGDVTRIPRWSIKEVIVHHCSGSYFYSGGPGRIGLCTLKLKKHIIFLIGRIAAASVFTLSLERSVLATEWDIWPLFNLWWELHIT